MRSSSYNSRFAFFKLKLIIITILNWLCVSTCELVESLLDFTTPKLTFNGYIFEC